MPFQNLEKPTVVWPCRLLMRRSCLVILGLMTLGLTTLGGCAGYRMGTRTLYRSDIRTIHVPIIRTNSFRADLGVRLTEIVQKMIEDRTPYKLANEGVADSTLICEIRNDTKRTLTESLTDEPRAIRVTMVAEVNWVDRTGNVLMQNRFLPPGETTFYFSEQSQLVPEGGQSISSSQQRALERLADHIVDQMEARW